MQSDTIAAISTPAGEGGIGIVRVSGPQARKIGTAVFRFAKKDRLLQSHRLYYGHIIEAGTGELVDEALISFMAAPHTYTREDIVEINCHGGILPLGKTLSLVLAAGARLAEPGEFTQRAFLNGRLDLAQAEAVIQVIRAKTETAMKLGLSQLNGKLSGEVINIRQKLLGVVAHIEASIDFPEHQDVEEMAREAFVEEVNHGAAQIKALLDTADRGRILREGLRTAIVGRPNVGKSSLLNALLREQRAIVTAVPGTTRDLLEESVNIGGVTLTIVDTAGIRLTEDEVEMIGVDRAREMLQKAGLVLLVIDISVGLTPEDLEIMALAADSPVIVIANKADLVGDPQEATAALAARVAPRTLVSMSLLREEGLAGLEKTIRDLVLGGRAGAAEHTMVTTVRHKEALSRAFDALQDALSANEAGCAVDLLAIDLYSALNALGEITGETLHSEVINEIFRNFCIGK